MRTLVEICWLVLLASWLVGASVRLIYDESAQIGPQALVLLGLTVAMYTVVFWLDARGAKKGDKDV